MSQHTRFTLRALLLIPVAVALFCVLALLPLRMMREAQQQEVAALRAAEAAAVRALQLAEARELAAREREQSAVSNTVPATPRDLRLISWNIESDGNDPETIARQLVELGRYDIYLLQEVKPVNFQRYGEALRLHLNEDYRYFGSSTGHDDRLMCIFDSSRLELLEVRELFKHQAVLLNDWGHRSPLVGEFRDLRDGAQFLVVTVHLARGNAELRTQQAEGLREWGGAQRRPVIAFGDFNMDYVFETRQGNAAFDAMLAGGRWRWVEPNELLDSNWYDGDGDGADDYPGSLLDFAFVTGEGWDVSTRVIVRDGDFPDDEATADHRPVELIVAP